MAKASAEKQKEYRERHRARLGEEFLKKERERVKKQCEWQRKSRMVRKLQQTVRPGEERKDEQGRYVTESVQKEPLVVHFRFNKTRAQKAVENTRKRVSRRASKAYRQIESLEEENANIRRKVSKYRKAAYRNKFETSCSSASSSSQNTSSSTAISNDDLALNDTEQSLTPRSQANKDLRGIRMKRSDAAKIKRKLVKHNALIEEIKEATSSLIGKKRQCLHGFVTGRILQKYRAVNAVRREIGMSNNVCYRVHKKTTISSPKKANCFVGMEK